MCVCTFPDVLDTIYLTDFFVQDAYRTRTVRVQYAYCTFNKLIMDHGCIILKIDYRFVQFFFYIYIIVENIHRSNRLSRGYGADGDPTIVLTVNEDLL